MYNPTFYIMKNDIVIYRQYNKYIKDLYSLYFPIKLKTNNNYNENEYSFIFYKKLFNLLLKYTILENHISEFWIELPINEKILKVECTERLKIRIDTINKNI